MSDGISGIFHVKHLKIHEMWVMGCGLWVMGCGLWVMGLGVRVSGVNPYPHFHKTILCFVCYVFLVVV